MFQVCALCSFPLSFVSDPFINIFVCANRITGDMRSSALVILVVMMAVVCAGQSIGNLTELVTKLPLHMQTQLQPLLLGLPPLNSSAFFGVGTGILQAVNRTLSSFVSRSFSH